MSRYVSAALPGPRLNTLSATLEGKESMSISLDAITHLIPNSQPALIIRSAISPLFAISILFILGRLLLPLLGVILLKAIRNILTLLRL